MKFNCQNMSHQVMVVSIFSSKYPEATPCDGMIEDLYYGINYRSLDSQVNSMLLKTSRLSVILQVTSGMIVL